MSLATAAKEKLIAHATELILAAAGTLAPTYLLLAEDRLSQLLRQIPSEWLVRTLAFFLAVILWLAAWLFYRRPKLRFVEDIGVYFDLKTKLHVCPRCQSEKKKSFLKNEDRGFRCTACRSYFSDPKRQPNEEPSENLGPQGWMAR